MALKDAAPIAFLATTNADAARAFYEGTLGLTFAKDDNFALLFQLGPTRQMLRIAKVQEFTPLHFTVLGWEVPDIHAAVAELTAKGVEMLRIGYFQQDDAGVWTAPDGSKVAWFKDPDGNTLSLSTHAAA
jgi:catechol 2,3-dioxygenase-like lactoylglutathione lyase family enzyme